MKDGRAIKARSGQAILESFIAILLLCLVLFGLLQVLLVYNARTLAHHAAARTARARSVGLNQWMQEKVMHVASIPASGKMINALDFDALPSPDVSRGSLGKRIDRAMDMRSPLPPSAQTLAELEAISLYMTVRNSAIASHVLNYEAWEEERLSMGHWNDMGLVHVRVWNRYPLEMPFHRLFYAPWNDAVTVRSDYSARSDRDQGVAAIEHYELYLDDQEW